MITIPIVNVQLNALDALLATLGARLAYLAKHSDDVTFLALIQDKKIALQFSSDDGVARYYRIENNAIAQTTGRANDADLTIHFKDSNEGAKLLARGDTVALMQAIQDGKLTITGDYKLILWFVSLAKHALKVPTAYQPYVDSAKPYIDKAKPYLNQAQNLAAKALRTFKPTGK